jgi:hypothetical protein
MLLNRLSAARFVLIGGTLGLLLQALSHESAAAGVRNLASAKARVPSAVSATLPLGISGLATNRDGSYTLWVANTGSRRVVVDGTSVFGIIDVVLRVPTGYRVKVRSGSNCSAQTSEGRSSIECLPTIEPRQVVPVVTFTSNRPYPVSATTTSELNSTSNITVALNVAIPSSDRSSSAIRTYLTDRFNSLGLRSSVVFVDAGKPSEYAYSFSAKTIPLGWVTFVVTNRGKLDHSFKVCPSSGELKDGSLLNTCLQSTYEGVSYAPEVDDTLPLKPGQTAFFTMRFKSPGKYEYLSDISGQPQKGAKAQLVVK